MSIIENAVSQMEAWANDNSHGYDQVYRWGERGDYDCSSAVITAWKKAGVPLTCTYTGNMYSDMKAKGFVDVTADCNLATSEGMKRGDVLLNHRDHVAMYCGNGREVEASINEFGGVRGGQPGDQTGFEFLIRSYRNYPWDCVLRYVEADPTDAYYFATEEIAVGSTGIDVHRLQLILKARGFYAGKDDYSYGLQTFEAVKKFQKAASLPQTGKCDRDTWHTLLGLEYKNGKYKAEPKVWRAKKEADKTVLLVQELLKGSGYYTGKLTWNFNRPLVAAIKKFQKAAKKLEVNGKLDIPTLKWMIG